MKRILLFVTVFFINLFGISAEASTVEMYRLYNKHTGEHFYTAALGERNHLIGVGWIYEGIGWVAPVEGQDVYRLYNPNAKGGDHHYTTNPGERDHLIKVGWKYEGVSWKSGGELGLHRLFNPNTRLSSHHYTTSLGETNHLVSLGWHYEGFGWYAVAEGYPDPYYVAPITTTGGVTSGGANQGGQSTGGSAVFSNCTEAWRAGAAPIRRGEHGYSPDLDRNGDGIACETRPRGF